MSIHTISVIGAGLMGHGIALTMARAGFAVIVTDPVPAALDSLAQRVRASLQAMGCSDVVDETLGRISTAVNVASAVSNADLVFEAAPEKLDLKRQIFAEIEAHAPKDAILASNTSVMPITQIMAALSHKSRALGTHWWNPAHMIPLVEVISTQWTDPDVADAVAKVLELAGKSPVKVARDVPGFIGNRLQHALWREAVSLVENGICDAEGVDTVVKQSFGRRLAVLGPLENADLVGTDLTLDIHNTVLADLEARPGPSPYLENLVAQGRLGMKTGQGFRDWTEDTAQATRDRVATHLTRLEGILPKA
ncbi:3-hydroxyacyl-CoA dehydrogenase [Thioclava sp. SK-1]|uniref:3-hydroxyacyl-CoA dehydrogenase family protein n=1 Tax=Thioclava sp. SK-1 TaxID=1889770 RepID=UPI0008271A26|nr:3-hydroxyacyl-CoA dehydrogenase NAD-binding domain-containing protein [Thioclava sp. SK-1]OCX66236.1 3-hydroxyacyl-CoA dehydrogenase [Thioclava sp. SK-1]